MPIYEQFEKGFFNPGQFHRLPPPPTDEEIGRYLQECPLNQYVTNEETGHVINDLKASAAIVLKRHNHYCADQSFALYGPPSSGKSFLAGLWHSTIAGKVGFPYAEISSEKLTVDALLHKIEEACYEVDLEIVLLDEGYYKLPPIIVFLDEVHRLPKSLQEGALLTAIEGNKWLEPPEPKSRRDFRWEGKIDCSNVCWIIATTDSGQLFPPFRSRFDPAFQLVEASQKQVADITFKEMKKYFTDEFEEPPFRIAQKISQYCRLPRVAKKFVEKLYTQIHYQSVNGGSVNWERGCEETRKSVGIDEYGMHQKHLAIITALGNRGPIAKSNLTIPARVQLEELENYILPELFRFYKDRDALVMTTGRGTAITEAGMNELDKRGIPHKPIEDVNPNYKGE